jgi:hypothetical protein
MSPPFEGCYMKSFAVFVPAFLSNPEDEGDIFFRNVC